MFDPEFIAEPADHRLAKYLVRAGKSLQARYDEPFELKEGFFEKHDVIQIRAVDRPLLEGKNRWLVVGTHNHASCG